MAVQTINPQTLALLGLTGGKRPVSATPIAGANAANLGLTAKATPGLSTVPTTTTIANEGGGLPGSLANPGAGTTQPITAQATRPAPSANPVDGQAPAPVSASPIQNAPPSPFQVATGLTAGAGALGNGNVNPLAQLMQRQLSQSQPGGAGTPMQQGMGMMGQLGAPAGATQGPVGAQNGGITVPGTTNQSPFFNPSNAQNTQQAMLKAGATPGTVNAAQTGAIDNAVTGLQAQGLTGTGINNALIQQLTQSGLFSPQVLQAMQLNSGITGNGTWGNGPKPVSGWEQQLTTAANGAMAAPNLSSIILGGNG